VLVIDYEHLSTTQNVRSLVLNRVFRLYAPAKLSGGATDLIVSNATVITLRSREESYDLLTITRDTTGIMYSSRFVKKRNWLATSSCYFSAIKPESLWRNHATNY
jgi:hypothetical protein